MLPKAGQDVGRSSRWVLMKELKDRHVTLRTQTRVESIEPDGTLVYTEEEETRREPFDTVILAVGSAPRQELSQALREAGISFKTVGDCNSPRKIMDAVHEGYLAALVL
jgi:2,4-dienoyl-CoA reductase (NADPH2)